MTLPFKILFLPSWYPGPAHPLNGIFNQELADAMSGQNHVRLFYTEYVSQKGSLQFEETIRESGLCEIRVKIPNRWGYLIRQFRWYRAILRFAAREKELGQIPDLIHVQVAWKAGLTGYILSRKWKVPVMITEHFTGYLPEDGQLTGIKKWLCFRLLKNANTVTAVSGKLASALMAGGVKEVYTIPNPVHPVCIRFPVSHSERGDKMHFIHISNFDLRQKQTDVIIRQFSRLRAERNDVQLTLIVPHDKFLFWVKNHPETDLTDIVCIEPGMPREEYAEILGHCGCLISYSKFETFGLTIAESLCMGVPVITSRSGAPQEYTDEDCALFVDAGDPESLYLAMLRMAEGKKYQAEVIANKFRQRFSPEVVVKKYQELYQQMCT